MGRMDPPNARLHRPRKRALGIAKQLRLQQRLRNRRAIHHHERLLSARTDLVNLLRHQILARTTLARHQHRRIAHRNHPRQLISALHQLRVPNHPPQIISLRLQARQQHLSRPSSTHVPGRNSVDIDQLHQPLRYRRRRSISRLHLPRPGVQRHHLGIRKPPLDHSVKLIRVQIRQHRIQQQHSISILMLMEHLERPGTAAGFNDIPAWMPKLAMNALPEPAV